MQVPQPVRCIASILHQPHPRRTSRSVPYLRFPKSPQDQELTFISVGPAFPTNHPITSTTRYPTLLFTRPTPAFVLNTTQSKTVEAALNGASKSEKSTAVQTLYRQAISDLPSAHKRPKQTRAAFGFFEQSMLFNLGFVLLSTGATIAATVILGKRARAYYSH